MFVFIVFSQQFSACLLLTVVFARCCDVTFEGSAPLKRKHPDSLLSSPSKRMKVESPIPISAASPVSLASTSAASAASPTTSDKWRSLFAQDLAGRVHVSGQLNILSRIQQDLDNSLVICDRCDPVRACDPGHVPTAGHSSSASAASAASTPSTPPPPHRTPSFPPTPTWASRTSSWVVCNTT